MGAGGRAGPPGVAEPEATATAMEVEVDEDEDEAAAAEVEAEDADEAEEDCRVGPFMAETEVEWPG